MIELLDPGKQGCYQHFDIYLNNNKWNNIILSIHRILFCFLDILCIINSMDYNWAPYIWHFNNNVNKVFRNIFVLMTILFNVW